MNNFPGYGKISTTKAAGRGPREIAGKPETFMFRAIITIIVVVLFLIITLPYLGIEFLLSKVNPEGSRKRQIALVKFMLGKVLRPLCGARVHVTGLENIPEERCLFVGNHQSYFDIILSYPYLPQPIIYIVKQEFKKIPFLGFWMGRIGSLFLDRSDPRKAITTIKESCDRISSGQASVFIYPEGTRSKDGRVHEFHAGSFKAAQKTGCPIIPVAMKGTRDIWENHPSRLVPGDVYLTFGKPIRMADLDPEQKKHIGDYVKADVEAMLAAEGPQQ